MGMGGAGDGVGWARKIGIYCLLWFGCGCPDVASEAAAKYGRWVALSRKKSCGTWASDSSRTALRNRAKVPCASCRSRSYWHFMILAGAITCTESAYFKGI